MRAAALYGWAVIAWALSLVCSGHRDDGQLGKPSTLRVVLVVVAIVASRDAWLHGVTWVHVGAWGLPPLGLFLDDVAHRLTPKRLLELTKSLLDNAGAAVAGLSSRVRHAGSAAVMPRQSSPSERPVDPHHEDAG